mmetsp:Transcript_132029/g.381772  ORF Transcript_132029/g.381772 Transcript_132029/m.381772 type:complete len:205 (+) Transcript_132029:366-980(+)
MRRTELQVKRDRLRRRGRRRLPLRRRPGRRSLPVLAAGWEVEREFDGQGWGRDAGLRARHRHPAGGGERRRSGLRPRHGGGHAAYGIVLRSAIRRERRRLRPLCCRGFGTEHRLRKGAERVQRGTGGPHCRASAVGGGEHEMLRLQREQRRVGQHLPRNLHVHRVQRPSPGTRHAHLPSEELQDGLVDAATVARVRGRGQPAPR